MWIIRSLLLTSIFIILHFLISDYIRAQDNIDPSEMARMELQYTRGIYLREIPLHESPVPISIYSRDFLERFGFRTLRDFLDYMPSFYLVPGVGERAITFRGFRSVSSSSVLILEDEARLVTPDYESFPVDRAYSLQDIARIELLHGAGGSLYGTGAFSGVVSIERDFRPKERMASLSLGSEDQRGISASLAGESYYLFIRSYKEGSPLKDFSDTYEAEEANSLIFKYLWKEGDISMHYFKEKTRYSLTTEGKNVEKTVLDYIKDVNEVEFLNLSLRKVYTLSNYRIVINPYLTNTKVETPSFTKFKLFPAYVVNISPLKLALNTYCLCPLFGGHFLIGGELQYRCYRNYRANFFLWDGIKLNPLLHTFRFDEDLLQAIYFSYAYQFGKLGLHLGSRYERHEDYEGTFTHRLGLSYRILPRLSLLLSYTEGFNTPSHFHTEVSQIIFRGLPVYSFEKLKPERERTIQTSLLFHSGRKIYFRNTLFLQEQRERIWHDPGQRREVNLPPYRVWGVESEFIGSLGEHLFFTNFSYLRVAKGEGIPYVIDGKYLVGIPEYMFKGGASFRLPFRGEVYFSPLFKLIGLARDKDGKRLPSYMVTDLNLLFRSGKNFELNLRVDNLFDETYYRAGTVSAIPFGERRVSLDLKIRF